MASSAPDVDLKSRGLPPQMLVAGGAVVLAVYMYGKGPAPSAAGEEAPEEAETSFRLLWMLLWGFWRLVQTLLFLILVLLGVLVSRQRSILYVPVPPNMARSPKHNPHNYQSPKQWGLPYEDVFITTDDGVRIHSWLVYQPKEKLEEAPATTLVYFHGNAGNIGHRLENVRDMHRLLGVNVLIVDYRGYGDSEDGSGPCEEGFMNDALASYRWVVERIRSPPAGEVTRMSEDRILLFGRSIGGAVAIQLAARLQRRRLATVKDEDALPMPAGLVLENTFTSLRDMAVQVFPFLSVFSPLLRSPLIFDEWRSADSLRFLCQNHKDWACCLLSGQMDEIVPPIQMRQLHAVLKENQPKTLKMFLFHNGGHNDTPQKGGAEYWASFKKFMTLVAADVNERRAGAPAAEPKG